FARIFKRKSSPFAKVSGSRGPTRDDTEAALPQGNGGRPVRARSAQISGRRQHAGVSRVDDSVSHRRGSRGRRGWSVHGPVVRIAWIADGRRFSACNGSAGRRLRGARGAVGA